MKTAIKRIVSLALVMAFVCPLNMAMAQKSFSFGGSSFKSAKSAASKTRPSKAAPSKSRPSKTSPKKSFPSRVGSQPIRYNPSKGVTKVTPRLDRKTPVRPYLPSKIPGKTVSPRKPYPIVKPFPKPITKPLPRPIIKPYPFPIDLSGDKKVVDREPRAVRDAREERRARDERRDREERREGDDGDGDGDGDDEAVHDDHHDDHHDGHHDAHHDGHHGGPHFGLDFPRWGFAYGPNGIFIRGGGRYYDNGPRDVVIVDQPVVVERAAPVVVENVEIREVANLPEVHVASTISLSSKTSLGEKSGQVILDINGIALPTAVRSWTTESTTCTLPMIGLDKPKEARLVMLTADGQVAHSISVLLLPAKAPEVAPMK